MPGKVRTSVLFFRIYVKVSTALHDNMRNIVDNSQHPGLFLEPYLLTNSPLQVVSREEWLTARKDLLVKEKAALRARDAFNAQLRSDFPMVKLDKDYTFDGPNGKVNLNDLFDGRKQ